ncbi:hypothetical protein GCM10011410_24880 [Hoyosella rhizosphaerae]|uniref:Uncharacterized protein n=1 Tax=Hoyosella rhizosphaerae TaxID=1755582 RepID=A0A916UGH0_9ACTN|nr:hypothetical protein GCM10011410_24880 [Hoyosella rhizosphaerae]
MRLNVLLGENDDDSNSATQKSRPETSKWATSLSGALARGPTSLRKTLSSLR